MKHARLAGYRRRRKPRCSTPFGPQLRDGMRRRRRPTLPRPRRRLRAEPLPSVGTVPRFQPRGRRRCRPGLCPEIRGGRGDGLHPLLGRIDRGATATRQVAFRLDYCAAQSHRAWRVASGPRLGREASSFFIARGLFHGSLPLEKLICEILYKHEYNLNIQLLSLEQSCVFSS